MRIIIIKVDTESPLCLGCSIDNVQCILSMAVASRYRELVIENMKCLVVSVGQATITHPYHVINPRRACAAKVTVVVLCVCMCMYVCMCVCPLIPAASHIGITKEKYQRILRNTGIV